VVIIPQLFADDEDTFCVLKSGSESQDDIQHVDADGSVVVSGGNLNDSLEDGEDILSDFDDEDYADDTVDNFGDEEEYDDEDDQNLQSEFSGNHRTLYLITTCLESAMSALRYMGFYSTEIKSITCMDRKTVVYLPEDASQNE
jgi:hypothetical protein